MDVVLICRPSEISRATREGYKTVYDSEIKDILLLTTAVTGGTYLSYIKDGIKRADGRRVGMYFERLLHEFPFPSPDGEGIAISKERFNSLKTNVFYSWELETNYFTCKTEKGYSMVLFDDKRSFNEKLKAAQKLGITELFVKYDDRGLLDFEDIT